MEVKIKKLNERAVIPFKATVGSAGFDLVATSCKWDEKNDCWIYGTGISTEIPVGCVGFIYPRSSNRKTNYYFPNSVGCIDEDYRGEWLVCLKHRDLTDVHIPPYQVGDKIAQAIFMELPKVTLVEVDSLGNTERGDGGFGSTGK